jgi:hypothetical protein
MGPVGLATHDVWTGPPAVYPGGSARRLGLLEPGVPRTKHPLSPAQETIVEVTRYLQKPRGVGGGAPGIGRGPASQPSGASDDVGEARKLETEAVIGLPVGFDSVGIGYGQEPGVYSLDDEVHSTEQPSVG